MAENVAYTHTHARAHTHTHASSQMRLSISFSTDELTGFPSPGMLGVTDTGAGTGTRLPKLRIPD